MMLKRKRFELTVESKLENLPRIGEFIAQTMRQTEQKNI